MMYGAMFDEVDEGTAMFKLAPTRASVPAGVPIVTLDADGDRLPSDWYLQLAREAQRRLSAPRRSAVKTGKRGRKEASMKDCDESYSYTNSNS